MNSSTQTPGLIEDAFEAVAPPMNALQMDDDFDDEELGERPEDVKVCSLEPGCTWCE